MPKHLKIIPLGCISPFPCDQKQLHPSTQGILQRSCLFALLTPSVHFDQLPLAPQ